MHILKFIFSLTAVLFLASCGVEQEPAQQTSQSTGMALTSNGNNAQSGYTKYPVVLAHGLLGFDDFGPIHYWRGIKEDYESRGVETYITEVPGLGTIADRAEVLSGQIDEILATSGADKVNLIGHSMGGLDSRYLVSSMGYGNRVASVTTVGTPNRGTAIAEKVLEDDDALMQLVGETITYVINDESREEGTIEYKLAIGDLTRDHMRNTFNPQNPDDPRVFYQSYASVTTLLGITDQLEPCDDVKPELLEFFLHLSEEEGPNDGLTSVETAKWGKFRGTVCADHIDQTGWENFLEFTPFNHLAWWQSIVDDIRNEGF